MKKKKYNLFEKLIFTLLFGISSICLLGGWSIDNNGNLHSDNEYNGDTQVVVSTGSNWTSKRFDITLTPNTNYTLSYNFSKIGNSVNYVTIYDGTIDVLQMLNITSKTFTTTSQTNYQIYFHASTANGPSEVGTSTYSEIMINKGSTALPYEPYGIWYSQTNYEILENDIDDLNEEIGELEEQVSDLQSSLEQITQEYEDYQDLINNTVGITTFDISQYSVSVGHVPNQPSFDYTKTQDISNNFSTIGYLNITDIYNSYIQNTNNNTIYITTPQNNLLTFDMTFNYDSQPNTSIKTNLYLPDGNIQQFFYSTSDFKFKDEWTLANLVATSIIGSNYNVNEISYKDILITYESQGSILNEIKIGSNNGYNSGFNSGYNSALNKINEIQQELNTKTSLLEKATIDLQNKTNEYNMLLARYQQVTETPLQLNFQNLIWTIASSPFESFKQIWNVDILGFNIANFVIGVMSVFVVMYIIKKIF